nr:hypothetical protein [Tanacetum cinerariifolium]
MMFHYKAGLSQVEGRLVEFKNQEIKYYEKIRVLKFKVESRANCIESLTKELEELKKEKEGLDTKLTGYLTTSKDLDNLIRSQKFVKNKEGLDDIIIDYTRPSLSVESNPNGLQNNSSYVFKIGESTGSILSKPAGESKKLESFEIPTIRQQLCEKNKACFNCGDFDHLSYDCGLWVKKGRACPKNNYTHKRTKLEDSVRTKRSKGSKSTEVVDYILQVKKKLLTKKLEDSEAEHQV